MRARSVPLITRVVERERVHDRRACALGAHVEAHARHRLEGAAEHVVERALLLLGRDLGEEAELPEVHAEDRHGARCRARAPPRAACRRRRARRSAPPRGERRAAASGRAEEACGLEVQEHRDAALREPLRERARRLARLRRSGFTQRPTAAMLRATIGPAVCPSIRHFARSTRGEASRGLARARTLRDCTRSAPSRGGSEARLGGASVDCPDARRRLARAVSRRGGARTEPARGAAGGAHAAALARRGRRAGAPRRAGRAAARAARGRLAALARALGAAGHGQDHARAPARPGCEPAAAPTRFVALSAVAAGLKDVREVVAEAERHAPHRPAHGVLPRRDPPLQPRTAGRAAAARRGGHGHAGGRDHREPLLRGDRAAALALPRLHAAPAGAGGARRAARARARGPRARARRERHRGERRGRSRRSRRRPAATRAARSACSRRRSRSQPRGAARARGRPRASRREAVARGRAASACCSTTATARSTTTSSPR